jgi:gliding motility-associated lipoprotein GldH
MRRYLTKMSLLFLLTLAGCSGKQDYVIYYPFRNQTWDRFNFLRFEIPIEKPAGVYNVDLFIHHTSAYEFDDLDFHMVMTTPSGEERIKEYSMKIRRKDGGFTGKCTPDSCEVSIPLKQELTLSPGTMVIELENVVPRLQVRGLLGLGIRVTPVR